MKQMSLANIHITCHPNAKGHTFLLSAHSVYFPSQIVRQATEEENSNLSGHLPHPQRYQTKHGLHEENWKLTNMRSSNSMRLNNPWVKEEIREIKNIWRQMRTEMNTPKFMGCRRSSSKREFCSNKCLLQETRKISTRQPSIY